MAMLIAGASGAAWAQTVNFDSNPGAARWVDRNQDR
jgi:hypothetical protein